MYIRDLNNVEKENSIFLCMWSSDLRKLLQKEDKIAKEIIHKSVIREKEKPYENYYQVETVLQNSLSY